MLLETPSIEEVASPVFVSLAKFGDIIIMLPAFKAIYDRTGIKPRVMVAHQYISILEAVSYVEPLIFHGDWMDIPRAVAEAKAAFGQHPIMPKWWEDPFKEPDHFPGGIVLRVHGKSWQVDQTKYPNFMASMYLRSGFTLEEMNTLPLIFDKRDKEREAKLIKQLSQGNPRPMLLVNFSGETSPFPLVPELMRYITPFQGRLNIVRLDKFRAHRLYDLIGLMDQAIGMITVDTSTLHLAHASHKPYIALTRDGWSGSVPRGTCTLNIKYSVAAQRAAEIPGIIEDWMKNHVAHSRVSASPSPRLDSGTLQRGVGEDRKCWMTEVNKIALRNVTLWACCWSDDMNFYNQNVRVLKYCSKLFTFERILFFAHHVPTNGFDFDFIQIPKFTCLNDFNVFVNSMLPYLIKSDFAMSVHEDGFPIRPDLWSSKFLDYDYIGAPWSDGVVGNGGFNIESQKLLQEKTKLPPSSYPVIPSDNYVCRVHRDTLVQRGIRFAPTDVAIEFSTEMTGQKWPSLGFHGRRFQPEKFNLGWQLIQQSEC